MSSIAEAVVAAVQAAIPGRSVFDTLVPPNPLIIDPDGYVVVYCPEGDTQLSDGITGEASGKRAVVLLNSFAPDRRRAGWLSRHVTAYLTSTGVDVSGYARAFVTEHYNRPPTFDESVKEYTVVMYHDELHILFPNN